MYIQITTRCNLECEHCGFACTKDGEDMSFEIFKKAVDLSYDDNISIGGGEPTIHPEFWKFLGYSISKCDYVWLATNGTIKNTSIALAKMARSGVIGCALSLDAYHIRPDEEVVQSFGKPPRRYNDSNNDFREIRNTEEVIKAGRAKEWGDIVSCICDDVFIKPNGTVYWCGCENAPLIGHVFDDDIKNKLEIINEIRNEIRYNCGSIEWEEECSPIEYMEREMENEEESPERMLEDCCV